MASNACSSCGYGGKPLEEGGYLVCSQCGSVLGEKKPHIIWGFILALAALFFDKKSANSSGNKTKSGRGRRKKKAISFTRAYLTQMALVTGFILIVYFLNRPYTKNLGGLLIVLEIVWGVCAIVCALVAIAIHDLTSPLFDEYE